MPTLTLTVPQGAWSKAQKAKIVDRLTNALNDVAAEEGKGFTALAPETEARLVAHSWPGNVRELQNVLRNVVVLNDGEAVTPEMLPATFGKAVPGRPEPAPSQAAAAPPPQDFAGKASGITQLAALIRPLAEIEREAIERAIELCGGDVRKAAVFLGIAPATIYRRRKAWEEDAG